MRLTNNQDSLYTVLPSDFLAFFEYALTQKVSVKNLFSYCCSEDREFTLN